MTLSPENWKRHAHPWSGWTRIAATPLWYAALWSRKPWQIAAVAAWLWLNPRVFPPARDDSAWITQTVLGEQRWTRNVRLDWNLALSVLTGACAVPAMVLAYRRSFWPALALGSIAFLCKMWFIDRMAWEYRAERAAP